VTCANNIAPKFGGQQSSGVRRSSSFSFLRDVCSDFAVNGGESLKNHLALVDQLPAKIPKEEIEPLRCSISFDDILDPRGRLMHGVSIIAEVVNSPSNEDECKAVPAASQGRSCRIPPESLSVNNVHIFFFKTSSLVR
jgi:hypothetical protein